MSKPTATSWKLSLETIPWDAGCEDTIRIKLYPGVDDTGCSVALGDTPMLITPRHYAYFWMTLGKVNQVFQELNNLSINRFDLIDEAQRQIELLQQGA